MIACSTAARCRCRGRCRSARRSATGRPVGSVPASRSIRRGQLGRLGRVAGERFQPPVPVRRPGAAAGRSRPNQDGAGVVQPAAASRRRQRGRSPSAGPPVAARRRCPAPPAAHARPGAPGPSRSARTRRPAAGQADQHGGVQRRRRPAPAASAGRRAHASRRPAGSAKPAFAGVLADQRQRQQPEHGAGQRGPQPDPVAGARPASSRTAAAPRRRAANSAVPISTTRRASTAQHPAPAGSRPGPAPCVGVGRPCRPVARQLGGPASRPSRTAAQSCSRSAGYATLDPPRRRPCRWSPDDLISGAAWQSTPPQQRPPRTGLDRFFSITERGST